MAEEFPLPISSYKELIKIVQGYGRIGAEASLADVAALTAMHETNISGNNRFLVAILTDIASNEASFDAHGPYGDEQKVVWTAGYP